MEFDIYDWQKYDRQKQELIKNIRKKEFKEALECVRDNFWDKISLNHCFINIFLTLRSKDDISVFVDASEFADLLLSRGADVNFSYPRGAHSLGLVAQDDNFIMTEFLVNRGADISWIYDGHNIDPDIKTLIISEYERRKNVLERSLKVSILCKYFIIRKCFPIYEEFSK